MSINENLNDGQILLHFSKKLTFSLKLLKTPTVHTYPWAWDRQIFLKLFLINLIKLKTVQAYRGQ